MLHLVLGIPADARHLIEDTNRQMGRLMVSKRYDTLTRMTYERFAPEFIDVRSDGRKMNLVDHAIGGEYEMQNLRDGKSDGPIRWRTVLDGWNQTGEAIVVFANHDVTGEWLTGGRRLPVKFKNRVRQTWVRRDGTWKAVRFDEVWVKGTIDGKPFPPLKG